MATNLATFVKFHALLEYVGKQQELVTDSDWVMQNQIENLVLASRLFAYVGQVAKDSPEFGVAPSSPAGQEIIKEMIKVSLSEINSLLESEGF